MKRLIWIYVIILCLLPLAALSEEIPWDQHKEIARQVAAAAYPGWTIGRTVVYGSGVYRKERAQYADVLLCRVEGGMLRFLELHILINPLLNGEPAGWQERHFAPVPLNAGSAADIAGAVPMLKYPEDGGIPWLSFPSGYAEFMLREGESWEELGAASDGLIGVSVNAAGQKGLRIAKWNGSDFAEVTASPMTEKDFALDTFHSGDGFLILDLSDMENEYYAYISRGEDGAWYWSGVNTGHAIYRFCDAYMLDDTYSFYDSNVCHHYGRMTLPLALEELDFSRMALKGPELAAFLDASSWACVRENETPVYAAPDAAPFALCYARLAGTVAAEEGDWVCLQIGSEEHGLRGWFRREQLAFGAETEDVRCGFPAYEAEIYPSYPWRKDLTAFVSRVLENPYGALDVDAHSASVWIIGRATDGRWLMEINEDIVAFTREGAELVTRDAPERDTAFDEEKMDGKAN